MIEKTAVFPGSFDPVTKAHVDVIKRAVKLFDKLIIAVGTNSQKNYEFSVENRMDWLKQIFNQEPSIVISSYKGLTVDFCRQENVKFIIRGIRNTNDLVAESDMAALNRKMAPDLDTVFFLSSPETAGISSSIVRDILKHGGDAGMFLPDQVKIS